jgi:MFS family permease
MTAAAEEAQKVGALATFRDMPFAAKLLLVGVFVNQFGAFLQAFLVLYLTHRGFSETHALYGMGAYGFGAVIGLLFGGAMSDRLGPRRTIIVSMVGSTVLPVAITLMNSYTGILIVAVLAGAMAQLYRPAAGSILATLVPPARQVMAFSMNRIALNLGVALGPFLAGALIASDHWDLLFWIDGCTALLYVVIALLFLPKTGGEADAEETSAARTRYWSVLSDWRYVVFMFAVLTNALIYIQSFSVLPLTLKDHGYSEHAFSWILTISATVLISCELIVTRFTQHWQPRVAASVGLVLLGVGLTAYGLPFGGLAIVFVGAGIGVIGQIIGGPSIFAYPAKAATPGATGRYLGAFFAMFGLGQALGPIIAAPIYHMIGTHIWYISGVTGLVSALTAYIGMAGRKAAAVSAPAPAEQDAEVGTVAGVEPVDVEAIESEVMGARDAGASA